MLVSASAPQVNPRREREHGAEGGRAGDQGRQC